MNIEDYFLEVNRDKYEISYITTKGGVPYYIVTSCTGLIYSSYHIHEIISNYKKGFFTKIYETLKPNLSHRVWEDFHLGKHYLESSINIIHSFSNDLMPFETKLDTLRKDIRVDKIDKLLK